MAVLSCFVVRNINKLNVIKSMIGSFRYECRSHKVWNIVPVRNCHERTLLIRTSRYEHNKFKDFLNLYFLIGALPIMILITYVNIFIGPATLALIPEGYDPKPWEYHRHPITRFFAKYLIRNPHERHERNLHYVFLENEQKELTLLRNKILDMIKHKQDYQSWYFEKPSVKYVRKARDEFEEEKGKKGISRDWIH